MYGIISFNAQIPLEVGSITISYLQIRNPMLRSPREQVTDLELDLTAYAADQYAVRQSSPNMNE